MQSEFEILFKDSVKDIDMTPGSMVNAQVVEIRNDYIVINAGLKSEGIIPKNQFLDSNGELEIKVGDKLIIANRKAVSFRQRPAQSHSGLGCRCVPH